MNKQQKSLIDTISKQNTFQYNIMKASEECQELSLILTQLVNKPDKVDKQDIIDEIGDVIIRIQFLKNVFNKEDIEKRVDKKLEEYSKYLELGTYKNI